MTRSKLAIATMTGMLAVSLVAGCSSDSSTEGTTVTTREPTTTSSSAPRSTTTTAAVTTTTQTTPADGPNAEQLALAEAIVSAFNAEDLEGFLAVFGASPAFMATEMTFAEEGSGNEDRVREELPFRWAMEEAWTLGECYIEYGALTCRLAISDNLSSVRPLQEGRIVILQSDDGTARKITLKEDRDALAEFSAGFHAWVVETAPGKEEAMFVSFSSGLVIPKLTQEAVALRLDLLPRYLETIGE